MAKLAQEMVDSVFSFGELGMQEVETSKYLTAQLEKYGFTVQRGFGGIPTAWVAKFGIGQARDSRLAPTSTAFRRPRRSPASPTRIRSSPARPGHGEGHNTGMPMNIVAAIAVKRIMERDKLPGTIMLWPGVAEEQLGTKAWYVRDGMFKDVDVVLFAHVGNNLGVGWGEGGGNGMVSVEYTFEGETRTAPAPRGAAARRSTPSS
jgi:aminobenzoyl-glutamate utilization protein B